MTEPTARQAEIHRMMLAYQRLNHGLPMTVHEIGTAAGISSPHGVRCHLVALVKKGWLIQIGKAGHYIAIQPGCCPTCGQAIASEALA